MGRIRNREIVSRLGESFPKDELVILNPYREKITTGTILAEIRKNYPSAFDGEYEVVEESNGVGTLSDLGK